MSFLKNRKDHEIITSSEFDEEDDDDDEPGGLRRVKLLLVANLFNAILSWSLMVRYPGSYQTISLGTSNQAWANVYFVKT